jgi:AraC-like DNA-binding protein
MDEFVADPIGRYRVGATHVLWCASPTFCGSIHWGRLDERELLELTRWFEIVRHPALRRFAVYIEHQAVVLDSGPVALILAGVAPLTGPSHPLRFFSSREDASAWLGRDELPAILDEVDALAGDARGRSPELHRLRAYLDAHLREATVEDAACALQRSTRSLQRCLRNAGSGFGAELTRARLDRACALLTGSDEKVETIARRVGYTTSTSLSVLFRRELGETPARYRERHKPDAKGDSWIVD